MKKPKVSKNPNVNWRNNAIQFPRLIAELEAIGVFTYDVLDQLWGETNLTRKQVCEVIERAQAEWDYVKTVINDAKRVKANSKLAAMHAALRPRRIQ